VKKVLITSFVAILFISNSLKGQEFIWKAGNFSFFDNREYFNKYVLPQTMGGTQTFANIGIKVDENNSFSAGVNFLYEFGGNIVDSNFKPIVYYQYNSNHAKLFMGSFARHDLYKIADVLECDTFQYYRPNNEGIFLEASQSWGKQNVWLDWISRQSITDREEFLIGATGQLNPKRWIFRYDFIMHHHAGPAIDIPGDHIRDNGGLVAWAGYNLTPFTSLDSLFISTGGTMSYDRLRNVYDVDYRFGSLSVVYAMYKGYGIRSTLYMGEGQTQTVGDGLYAAKFYDRTDFIWQFLNKGHLKGEVELSLHFLPEVVDFSQKLTVYIDFDGSRKMK
jgi:hypothetical protein